MDPKKQQKDQTRNFTELGQDSSLDMNFYDFKGGQNSFLSQQTLGYDTDSACSSDLDRNMGLQVVPSFDDDVFADSFFSHIDYEHIGFHQNNDSATTYQPEENLGKLGESLACLPEKEERIDSISAEINTEENATGPERRHSDTDSLDVYLKPCVITPTKVEDLYSTLESQNNIIFQFPPEKMTTPLECSESNVQANQENEGLDDSNAFEIQLCSLSHHEGLNIESGNDRNLNPYHSNDLFEQKCHCFLNTNMGLSHRLASHHLEPESRIQTNNDSPSNIPSILSNTTEFQKPSDYSESSSLNESSFPPFLLELSNQRCFPLKEARGKPANICQNIPNGSISLNCDKKDYLHTENKDNSSDKREAIKEEPQGKLSTAINVFREDSKTIPHHVQNQERTANTKNDEKQAEPRKFDNQNFKHLLSHSETLKKESCVNISLFEKNYMESDVEMSSEVRKIATRGKTHHDTRNIHNDTEKQRRDDMKTRFENLRQVIPKIENVEKTPKVQILKQAWKYITYLEQEEQTLEIIKTREKEYNQKLLKRLQNIVKGKTTSTYIG
ncbi:myc protein-like [Actinia tenebrosa]|uniref:Myc protein-like n=1 Tax=Actinia tenebrosa TaxID=6105 RepID=A0A6P8J0J4_ACTTE|nr:myc protein-like [Actinia tenebrosa]